MAALCLTALAGPTAAAGNDTASGPAIPGRIVSLNLCADELVLRLAPERVVSVTSLARDPGSSTVADPAASVPINRGLAEEVVPLRPDLVIAGAFTTRATVTLLRRFGIEVMELGVPRSLEDGYAQIRAVATRLGVPEQGEAMIAAIRAAVDAAPPPRDPLPRAVVLRPNGFTVGRATLADDLMRRAGLDNIAARLRPDRLGQLTLEEIVVARPEVLVVDDAPDAPPSLAREMMRHPAVAGVLADGHIVALPTRLWACVGPQLAEAIGRLAAAAHPDAVVAPQPAQAR